MRHKVVEVGRQEAVSDARGETVWGNDRREGALVQDLGVSIRAVSYSRVQCQRVACISNQLHSHFPGDILWFPHLSVCFS